jgi:HKD family nuclease
MRLQIIDNDSKEVFSILSPAISQSDDVRIAVAFVSRRGLAMIEPAIDAALRAGSHLEFLIGLDLNSTDPIAVRNLYNYSLNNTRFSLYCYASLGPSTIYHPKLYAIRNGGGVISVIGSSNLTEGGLKRNVEVNVVIEGNIHDELISDIYGTYNILKFHQKRVVPDNEYITLYEKLSELGKKQLRESTRDKPFRDLIKTFNEKSDTLRRP